MSAHATLKEFEPVSNQKNGKLPTRKFIKAVVKQFAGSDIANYRTNFVVELASGKLWAFSCDTGRWIEINNTNKEQLI